MRVGNGCSDMVGATQPTWRRPMSCIIHHRGQNGAATQANDARILVSLELSRHTWLVTALAGDPGQTHEVRSLNLGELTG
jgi:hypothetical protein